MSPGAVFEGLIFGGAYLRREMCVSKLIGLARLIVESKLAVFALVYFVFEGNFPSTRPWGSLYLKGRFNGRFFALPV